jgi:hypothetical protein
MPAKSAGKQSAIFRQVCELIPPHMVATLARKHKVKSRGFSPWSHTVSMLYAQFTHAIGLNDVCDGLQSNKSSVWSIRGATPPSRNGLSHANKTRDSRMAEELFWSVLKHLGQQHPGFGGAQFGKLPRRFKRTVHAVDSTTIKLFANCMDWAKHRRRKAAAKLHLRLDLQSFLPAFAIVDSAKGHDNTKAHELCADLKDGEIVVFDMAYIDYKHLALLNERGVFWVCRVKESMKLRCVKRRLSKPAGRILRDDIVVVANRTKRGAYPKRMRRITAVVDNNGVDKEMVFFSNNLDWAPSSICDLYKCRWAIETFFKQIKQTLHLGAFLGHSRNAIQWQVWTALLMYVLLRFLHASCNWGHSFTRLYTCLRSVLWQRRCIFEYLRSYGTACGTIRMQWAPQQAFLTGFG